MKTLVLFALMLIGLSCGSDIPKKKQSGKMIYKINCVRCHGMDGSMGLNRAKDLGSTSLTPEEQFLIIKNGKKIMPAFKRQLSDEEIKKVVVYIERLGEEE